MGTIIHHPLIEALGYAVFHSLWQGALVFFIVQFALLFASSPARRYRVLMTGMFSLCFAFILTLILVAVNASGQVATGASVAAGEQSFWKRIVSFPDAISIRQWMPFISLGYAMGLALLCLRLALSWYKLYQVKTSLQSLPEGWQTVCNELKAKMALLHKVSFAISDKVLMPFVSGVLKPLVVLPIALINQWDSQQAEAIILHELAHIKRNDFLWNIIQVIAETLLFFNPVAWWLSAGIRKEREMACDDLALKHIQTPVKYAEALLVLAEINSGNMAPALAADGNDKKQVLFNRVKRIIGMKTNQKKSHQGIMAVVTLVMLAVATASYFVAGAQDKKEDKPVVIKKSSSKTSVVVKDDNGNVRSYNTNSEDNNEMPEEARQAMEEAQKAINDLDLEETIRTAMEGVDQAEIQKALDAAQEEIDNIDWEEINRSVKEATSSIKDIDWDEIGRSINEGLKSVEGIGDRELRDAMQEVKKAMQEAKQSAGESGFNSKEFRESSRVAMESAKASMANAKKEIAASRREMIIDRERMREEIRKGQAQAKVEFEASMQQHKEAMREHGKAVKEHSRAVKKHYKTVAANDRLTNQMLTELEKRNLIENSDNFSIHITDKDLYVDGKKQSTEAFESVKKYLPKGNNSFSVTRSKTNN